MASRLMPSLKFSGIFPEVGERRRDSPPPLRALEGKPIDHFTQVGFERSLFLLKFGPAAPLPLALLTDG
jgi:hypothetical protein